VIYDMGSRSTTLSGAAPRAVWYGLEFVRYALCRAWLGTAPPAHLRGHNTAALFEQHYQGFRQSTSKRLRYYRAHLAPGLAQLQLLGVYRATGQDSNRQFYTSLLHATHGVGGGAAAAPAAPTDTAEAAAAAAAAAAVEEAARLCAHPAAASSGLHLGAAAAAAAAAGGGGGGCALPGLIGEPGSAAAQQLGPADAAYFRALLAGGYGMYAGGLSHQQFIDVGGKAALTGRL
jgi:hypothetical protein